MREVELLPAWYLAVRRQRTLLAAQTWITAGLVVAGLVSLVSVKLRAAEARVALADSRDRATESVRSVRQLEEMITLQRQMVAKRQIVADVGLDVTATRVIGELVACAPPETCFDQIELRTDEQSRPLTLSDRAGGASGPALTRRMLVRVTGVAPSENLVTLFWTNLFRRPFIEEARIVNTAEKIESERVMRAFELSLSISLDAAPAQASADAKAGRP